MPRELRVGNGDCCKSACEAFGSPEFCCNSAFNAPSICRPSVYSEMFESTYPRSYSYAYDDATSTFSNAYDVTRVSETNLDSSHVSSSNAERSNPGENDMMSKAFKLAGLGNPRMGSLGVSDSDSDSHADCFDEYSTSLSSKLQRQALSM
ncbi:pathogenesis-related thaumatin-like protein 3.4 [Macadamia integrifolia]|uniref:pathogenesis-related thaumatin-like protein 3.4 n=1 Tax=Macadamia integrifolia TaxID=60698 RepID=UPI001C4FD585|nr:pathogenesis-related thaumatin-like protein 3.4 [Macadamia integrifolia]